MAYPLFSVFGIEIEYAVVRSADLSVDASVDKLLTALSDSPGGPPEGDAVHGNVESDHELAAHVLELKCLEPARDWASQADDFAASIPILNRVLSGWGARLMPGGMHPFMDPARESRLWPHGDRVIYDSFDRIFGCRGHGWLNIQSTHLNLPFAGDAEFARLHSAISLLLPLLPALAASSPVYAGRAQGWLDGRLRHYVENQRKLPAIIGNVIPEPVGSEAEYRERVLQPMWRAIAPYDPEGLMRGEWLNSRAAIARFDRSAVEIRCLDTQERPRADVAVCAFVTSVLRHMLDTGEDMLALHRATAPALLQSLFLDSARIGAAATLPGEFPFRAFGLDPQPTVGHMLRALRARALRARLTGDAGLDTRLQAPMNAALDVIFNYGSLAERILKAAPTPDRFLLVYTRLCECLERDEPFIA